MNTPAPLSRAQALKKYDKATRLRWRSPISEWRAAFPTVESLAEFRRDVGDLSWPGSYGQSPWDDAFSLAYNLGEGVSESSRRFMLENADCDWGRQMLAVYAEYGLKVEPSPAPVVAPAAPAVSVGPWGIPSDFPVRPIGLDDEAKDRCTCGYCGLSWDDGIATAYTPAPSGRCPFEAFHKYEDSSSAEPATSVESVQPAAPEWLMELFSSTVPAGTPAVLTSPVKPPCPRCGGSGRLPHFQHMKAGECFKCHGTGTVA